MRSLARGSDGLAEVNETDLCRVLIPIISDESAREQIKDYLIAPQTGKSSLSGLVKLLQKQSKLPYLTPKKRPHHAVLA